MFDITHIPQGIPYTIRRYQAGDTIMESTAGPPRFFVLCAGQATVYLLGEEGQIVNIYNYTAPGYFGEARLLCESQNSERAIPLLILAKTDCTCHVLAAAAFFRWLQQDFSFTLHLLQEQSEKMLHATGERGKRSTMGIRERTLAALRHHAAIGDLHNLTKAQLCEEVDTSRRCLNRVLAECEKIVEYKDKQFTLK